MRQNTVEFESTRWIQCAFTSIISFIFHLPILLVPPDAADQKVLYKADDTPRHSHRKQPSILDVLRAKHFHSNPHAAENFYWIHHSIFTIRIIIHVVVYTIVWIPLSNVKLGVTTQRNSVTAYIGETFSQIRSSPYVHAASWLMLASTLLWIATYIHFRWHFARLATTDPVPINRTLYALLHLDPINFIFDIPDYKVSTCRRSRLTKTRMDGCLRWLWRGVSSGTRRIGR